MLTQKAKTRLLGGQTDGLGHWPAGQLTLRGLGTSYLLTEPEFPQQSSLEFLKGRQQVILKVIQKKILFQVAIYIHMY